MTAKRRRVLVILGGIAISHRLPAFAQSRAMPVVGFLHSAAPGPFADHVAGFRKGLGEVGYVEGRNVEVQYRWAQGRYERLPELAAELVRLPVAVLVATGGDVSANAAKGASSTTPIVFVVGSDPVKVGLVQSLSRPGANLTGMTLLTSSLEAKRLELIAAMVPSAKLVAALFNPGNVNAQDGERDVVEAARRLGKRVIAFKAKDASEFESAFAAMSQQRVGALMVGADPLFNSQRGKLVELTQRFRLPTMFQWKEFASAGGLMSYGPNLADAYRQAGVYAGRILKGAKPGDLPVLQPSIFEYVVNRKTAMALGITIPQSVLLRADEVLE